MTDWNPSNPFDLGIWDQLGWTPPRHPQENSDDDADTAKIPPAKKSKRDDEQASVSSKKSKLQLKKTQEKRFVTPEKDLQTYQKSFCPENTKVNTRWALNNFAEWQKDYNERHPEDTCPDGVLLTDDRKVLALWLQRYALSTRKKNGEKYPPKTVYLLLCSLQRHMREVKEKPFNIFDREDADFKLLFNTCDNYFRELRVDGVGAEARPTEVLTREDEERLWDTGVMSPDTPKGLLNAVFFYNGKNFMLRGGAEHRNLKLSQLQKNVSPAGAVRYTYTENASKNRSGGFNQLNVENKIVHQYQDLSLGARCHVAPLDMYFSKLPETDDIFYVRPVSDAQFAVNPEKWLRLYM